MPLEDLSCAGCGAPLRTADAQGRAIVCPYCQREHVPERSVRPADAPPPPKKAASGGSGVNKGAIGVLAGLVLAGVIAAIVMVGGGASPVEPSGRAVDHSTPLAAGQPVQVEWSGSWYEAHIRALHPDGRVRVHYEGWDDTYDEDVSRDRVLLRPGGEQAVQPTGAVATGETELTPGQRIQIEWLGTWYEGSVLDVHPDGRVRVHYEGWDETYDEDVPRERVRVP